MARKTTTQQKFKLVPDWDLPEGKSRKDGEKVRVHPYALISYAQRKWGIIKASELAISLLKLKYGRRFDDSKVFY